MRYSGKYTHGEVENARARCTFGDEGTESALLGPAYRKEHKDKRRKENREKGAKASVPWRAMFGKGQGRGKPPTNADNIIADSFVFTIINQDPTKTRATLNGKDLGYHKQMMDASDSKTILGFARLFYISLYHKEPGSRWLADLRDDLRRNEGSALFSGYGWELRYTDHEGEEHFYFKN